MNSEDIIGHWIMGASPEKEPDPGFPPSDYFYPDHILIIQSPRRREFVARAKWKWVNDQIYISEVHWLHSTEPPQLAYEPVPSVELTGDAMLWKQAPDGEEIHFRKEVPCRIAELTCTGGEPRT